MAEWVELTASDGHTFKAWRAAPAGKAKGAIVVIMEIFGVNSHIRNVTERFAREGYVAIAPALFDRYERDFDIGYGQDERPKAMAIIPKLDIAKAMLDAEASRAAVASAGKVGIVGFCFGGVVAWLGATRLKFAASSCYYGGRIAALKSETPHCPVIMHFGAKDAHIPLSDAQHPALSTNGFCDFR